MKKYCVYTVLVGDYESLNEQLVAKQSTVDFICFTDNRLARSDTWKIVYADPILPLDPARTSRLHKICPHRFLADYEASLYIDNRIMLRKLPEVIFADLLKGSAQLICMAHSFRETVLGEFQEVIRLQLDRLDVILEQLKAYYLTCPDTLAQKPYNGGFIIRRHHHKEVIAAMEIWFAQVLRYSRRDQLSFNYALNRSPMKALILDMDIRDSVYSTVTATSRQRTSNPQRSDWPSSKALSPEQETRVKELIANLIQLEANGPDHTIPGRQS